MGCSHGKPPRSCGLADWCQRHRLALALQLLQVALFLAALNLKLPLRQLPAEVLWQGGAGRGGAEPGGHSGAAPRNDSRTPCPPRLPERLPERLPDALPRTAPGAAPGRSGAAPRNGSQTPCRDLLSEHACRPEACALDFCPTCLAPGLCDRSCGFCTPSAPAAAALATAAPVRRRPDCDPTELSREEVRRSTAGPGPGVRWLLEASELNKNQPPSPCPELLPHRRIYTDLLLAHRDGTLCVLGDAVQTRASSTVEMLRRSLALLRAQGRQLPPFCGMRIGLSDVASGQFMAYSGWVHPSGTNIPDFTLMHWREAGVCPDFNGLVREMGIRSQRPPLLRKCGWVGAVNSYPRIRFINTSLGRPELLEAIWPKENEGMARGRLSMEDQVSRYACLLDAKGEGYSGRVPMLLHSGRPLLYVARSTEFFFDRTFYAYHLPEKLEPWKHFVPVRQDVRDLEERLEWVLSPANAEKVRRITENAKRFAQKYLTTEAAVEYLADSLVAGARNLTKLQAAGQLLQDCPEALRGKAPRL